MTETVTESGTTELGVPPDADRRAWASTWAGALGALVMTSCCILPLVLVSLGVTGVFIGQLGALYQYKWITFALSAAFLGYGFWKAYRPVPSTACADGTCAHPVNRTVMRTILWVAATIVTVAIVFPYFAPFILSY
jgi:mercuric ion transport protein